MAVVSSCSASPGNGVVLEEAAPARGAGANHLRADDVCFNRDGAKDVAAAAGGWVLNRAADGLAPGLIADTIRTGVVQDVHRPATDFSVDTSYYLVDRSFDASHYLVDRSFDLWVWVSDGVKLYLGGER